MTERLRIANSRQIPSLFELMADRIPDVVWATDTDLRFTASFGSGLAALGLHPSEVIGKTLFEYFQTDDEAFPPLAAHGRALQGEAVDFEQVWQDRIFRCHLEQLNDGNGNVVGCLGFAQDITELKQIQDALGQSFEELRTIYECMVDGLLIADIQTKGFVKANPAICQMLGYSPEELLSMSVTDIHPKENHPTVLAAFQSQAEGQMLRADSLPVRRKDGSVFCADITANLIVYQGRPCLIGFFRDVTERRRAEEQLQVGLRTQNAISSLLRTTLESASLDEQFERILVSLFSIPWLALQAQGAIFVLDDNLSELVIRCQQGLPQELMIRCGRLPLGRCLCGRAASTRELLFADCVDARHETHYPGMLPHGHYCVPIISGDRVLGVLTLYLEEGHQTNPDEQAFLSMVADVLAALIVRERLERSLRERDMELRGAKKIQETLLPTSPPNVPGFDIAGRCFPAETAAGDHFDYLWLPDGSLLVALADVAGHGFGPAIVAADFCARLRTLSETICDLTDMAARLNAGLYKETAGEIFVTAILGRLDPTTRSLTCLNAGHPEALVFNSAGEVRARYSSQSFPFAIKPETRFVADEAVELADGDLVLLYTDGLTEAHARGKSLFGIERASQMVRENMDRTAVEIVEALYRAARQYAGAERLKDDITIVIVKVLRAAPEEIDE